MSDTPEMVMPTRPLPSEADALRYWKAEIASSRNPNFSIELAMDRARRFSRIDRCTLDANGNPIVFGETYYYSHGPDAQRVDVVGLDLRSPGYVSVWMVGSARYDNVQAHHLTPTVESGS